MPDKTTELSANFYANRLLILSSLLILVLFSFYQYRPIIKFLASSVAKKSDLSSQINPLFLQEVSQIDITGPLGSFALAKTQSRWHLKTQNRLPAHEFKVWDILSALSTLKTLKAYDKNLANIQNFIQAKNEVIIKLTGHDFKQQHTLHLGGFNRDHQTAYLMIDETPHIYFVKLNTSAFKNVLPQNFLKRAALLLTRQALKKLAITSAKSSRSF